MFTSHPNWFQRQVWEGHGFSLALKRYAKSAALAAEGLGSVYPETKLHLRNHNLDKPRQLRRLCLRRKFLTNSRLSRDERAKDIVKSAFAKRLISDHQHSPDDLLRPPLTINTVSLVSPSRVGYIIISRAKVERPQRFDGLLKD